MLATFENDNKITHGAVMALLSLTWRQADIFMLIWEAGIEGTSEFPVNSPRQYIWEIRKKIAGLGFNIQTIGRTGCYAFTRETRKRIEEFFTYG